MIQAVVSTFGVVPTLELFDEAGKWKPVITEFLDNYGLSNDDVLVVSEWRDVKNKQVAPRLIGKTLIIADDVFGKPMIRNDGDESLYFEHTINNKHIINAYVSCISGKNESNDRKEAEKERMRRNIWRLTEWFLLTHDGVFYQAYIAEEISSDDLRISASDISEAISSLGFNKRYKELRREARERSRPKENDQSGKAADEMSSDIAADNGDEISLGTNIFENARVVPYSPFSPHDSYVKEFIRILDEDEEDWRELTDDQLIDICKDIYGDELNVYEQKELVEAVRKISGTENGD
ncbi:MAG: hypothetical protein HQL34_05050 [Alphaproteobacteria bacterium]|nr:hypothetical protein [Alphaproteobacteria bacterium]